MDATVNDFFNEINEIAPPKDSKKKQSVWQECYDDLTGYSYYWNTKTDEVTWSVPPELKTNKVVKKEKISPKKGDLPFPPRTIFPSTSVNVSEDCKNRIYSIVDTSKQKIPIKPPTENQPPQKKIYGKDSDSEDEKIVMISSFGDSDSDSDEEPPREPPKKIVKTVSNKPTNKQNDSNCSEEEDDLDILTKIQKRAKELKELGGDLPPEVKSIVNVKPVNNIPPKPPNDPPKEKKAVVGLSLVAGYSDSEEEQENDEIKPLFPVQPDNETPKVSHSTLFPLTKPIDIQDFMQPKPVEEKVTSSTDNDFQSKAFQRKKRIGVALVNTVKRKEDLIDVTENERKGFGFINKDTTLNSSDNKVYPSFKKGGVMFVKSDVLNPPLPNEEETSTAKQEEGIVEKVSIKKEDVEELYNTLKEKLDFLCEGRPVVSPVQVMIIQAETLFMAMRDGALKLLYLQNWLNSTCADLIKLEKEAAPEGWLLQWDRSHKRYYYQNQVTGEAQWEYPQPDISRCDEAMDISTTPPPTEPTIHMSPPLPPIIRSPTPPPPPIISVNCEPDTNVLPDVPLPPETIPTPKFVDNGEPLPPGVDLPEMMTYNKPKETEVKPADPLYSALDSFYSDIAAIENTNSNSPPPPPPTEENKIIGEVPTELVKKKKKSKVKLAPGLAMKKKGVSKLVEKWKTVQQHFND